MRLFFLFQGINDNLKFLGPAKLGELSTPHDIDPAAFKE